MLYILLAAVLLVLIVTIFIFHKAKSKQVLIFDTPKDLTAFIRRKYSSQIKHNQPIHGFVLENASIQRTLQESVVGDLGRSAVDLQVNIITQAGFQEVSAPCGNIKAEFKKGDFVIVLPIHNERHGFWHYVTVAKLQPIYDGKKKSWIIIENYIQN
ncbi:hypothetical protein [Acinetobacter sp. 105-3]|uniref:hypothetical protein n=1 Tax=Acinetobacter sp. 105-3 TaxID=2686015 RepID=UPI00195DFFD3|nr:hypothetical protein [Acinetobacter sp. 105-3]MBM7139896.1 hypothetical protein [Acinetobacter sp. 105-3]